MGFFDKKYCDVCGAKIGLLGNRKLEDGNLCKNCAKKLSPWFDERRHSTVDQIKAQLAYREDNRVKAEAFRASRIFGNGSTKLYVDESAGKFAVHRGNDFSTANPDILDFSQARGCDLEIKERRREITRTVDGKTESYNPPRFEYSYDFKVTVRVNHPYFSEMDFDLNGGSVNTGETRMTGGNTGSWRVSSFFNSGTDKYNDMVQMGNELKEMIDGWSNGGSMFAAAKCSNEDLAQKNTETLKLGSPSPIPYTEMTDGNPLTVQMRFFCSAEVAVCNPVTVQSRGGLESTKQLIVNDFVTTITEALRRCNSNNVPVAKLASMNHDIVQYVQNSLSGNMKDKYGMELVKICSLSFLMTEESRKDYDEARRLRMSNAAPQETAQPVQTQAAGWTCSYCGAQNAGKFCTNCGARQGE